MANKRLPKGISRRPEDGVLEKLTPHYDLGDVKAVVVRNGAACFTMSAQQGFQAMGLTLGEAVASIAAMDGRGCFFKSMTTYHDENLWQDVYHVSTHKGLAYVKFQLMLPPAGSRQTPKLVISFKAK